MDTDNAVWVAIAVFVIGAFLGACMSNQLWRYGAIMRGYAIYCPIDGNLAWVGECEDTK